MKSLIPRGKEVSVVHLNSDWGYLAYIEKCEDGNGEPIYKVVRVPLEGEYRPKRTKSRSKDIA